MTSAPTAPAPLPTPPGLRPGAKLLSCIALASVLACGKSSAPDANATSAGGSGPDPGASETNSPASTSTRAGPNAAASAGTGGAPAEPQTGGAAGGTNTPDAGRPSPPPPPDCQTDADCPGTDRCHPETQTCVACLTEDDCAPGDLCTDSTCQPLLCAPTYQTCTEDGRIATCNTTGTAYADYAFCDTGLECVPDYRPTVTCLEPLPNDGTSLEPTADGAFTCNPGGPVALYLLVDPRIPRPWADAIRAFLASYQSLPGAFAGLGWLRGSDCDPTQHTTPRVPIARLPSHIEELDEELLNYDPAPTDAALPLGPALEGSLAYARAFAEEARIHTAVVVVTPGGAWTCGAVQDVAAIAGAAAQRQPAVGTFLTARELDPVAASGGTERGLAVAADTLDETLGAVFNIAARCFE